MEAQLQQEKFGLDTNTLKLIAITAMLIDHIGSGFVDRDSTLGIIMYMIGRITGPTMFYLVAEGYRHTRNVNRYTLRLFLFAAVSYLPYLYFHTGALPNGESRLQLNVIFTILMGHLAIRVQHEVLNKVAKAVLILALAILASFGDWGYIGFLMMLSFDFFYGNRKNQLFSYLLLAATGVGLLMVFLYPFMMYQVTGEFDLSAYPTQFRALGMILPAILIFFHNGEKGRGGAFAKWGFYIFYPLHFLLLGLIKYYLLPA